MKLGRHVFAPTENSVKSFLEDSRQLNLCRLKEKNICLELQCEPADLKKNFDKDLMLSLVNNFIDNAVKASADNSRLILEATAEKLMVQDFGKGIPAEDLDKVTEAFYRLTNPVPGRMEVWVWDLHFVKKSRIYMDFK